MPNSNTLENDHSIFTDDDSDHDRVLYHAASIFGDELSDLKCSDRYPAPNEIGIQSAYEQLPQKLFKIILWVIDSDVYASKAECILFASKNVLTTQHVGLAMQLHNDFGSQGLTDTLRAYGFCISYDELRHSLTSATEEMKRIKEGVYIPTEIIARNEGGNLIHEGYDNIDINAETIDGKNTFHAMTRVVFQRQSPDTRISFASFSLREKKVVSTLR